MLPSSSPWASAMPRTRAIGQAGVKRRAKSGGLRGTPACYAPAAMGEQRKFLECEVEAGQRRCLTLDPPGLFRATISRLTRDETNELLPWARPIGPFSTLDFWPKEPVFLARVAVAAMYFFGRSGPFGPSEGSFRYRLLFLAERDRSIQYLMSLMDVRGIAVVGFARLGEIYDPNECASYGPAMDEEMSLLEAKKYALEFIEFLYLAGRTLERESPDFYRVIPGVQTIYGCRGGECFEREFPFTPAGTKAFRRTEREIAAELDPLMNVRRDRRRAAILADVGQGVFRQ